MADAAEFELRLINSVTGPAKQMADALRGVEAAAGRAQGALSKRSGGLDSADKDVRRMGLAQIQAAAMDQRMKDRAAAATVRAKAREAAAVRRLGLAQIQAQAMNEKFDKKNKKPGFFGGFGAALPFRSIGDYAKGAFFGELAARATIGIAGAFVHGATAAVGIVTSGVKMAFQEGGKAENLRLSYRLLLGAAGGKAALGDISGFAGKTKYDDDRIAEMMRPLFNAGLKGQAARSAFAASGDLEAAGLGQAQDFIEQFAKIQLKGGVSEKMLLSMGVNVRDFKAALAESTDATKQDEAFKKAEEGKLDPQRIMNAIFTGIEKRQGGMLGTGTVAASQTMDARVNKIFDLPSQYLKKMSESPSWNMLSDRLGEVLESLDPDSERGQAIVGRLFAMFNKLVDMLDRFLQPENLDAFVQKLNSVLDGIGKIADFVAHPLDTTVKGIGSAVWGAIDDPMGIKEAQAKLDAANDNYAGIRDSLNTDGPRAANATTNNRWGSRSLTVNGGINLNLPAGVDGKQTAQEFYKELDRRQHASAGRAAAEGGG